MTRTIHHVAQRSAEWYALRVGKLTASVAGDMFGTLKSGKESAARRDLRCRLALEQLTGVSGERPFTAPDVERGRELEAEALAAYEARTGLLLDRVGFVSCDELPIGCSPDAVMDSAGWYYGDPPALGGGVDVKCPRPANHLAYLEDPALLIADYEAQCAHTLLVTGAGWWDLASYCPSMPGKPLLIVRVAHHEFRQQNADRVVDVAAYELVVRSFLREVENEKARILRVTSDEPKEAA